MSKGIEFRESGYAGAIADALNLSEPRQAVESVKQIVIREISELDRGAVVKSTDYFNHTFAPDLVLKDLFTSVLQMMSSIWPMA
jgi:hypothetical protein